MESKGSLVDPGSFHELQSTETYPPKNSRALAGGIVCSAIWVVIYGIMAYHADRCFGAGPLQNTFGAWWASHVSCLKLNEIGDSMAGLAGPLGFIWFLTAVLLQMKELEYTRHEFEQSRQVAQDQLLQFEKQVQLMDAANIAALHNAKLSYRVGMLDRWIEVFETAARVLEHIHRDPDEYPPPLRGELVRAAQLATVLRDKSIADWLFQLLHKGEAYFQAKTAAISAHSQFELAFSLDPTSSYQEHAAILSRERQRRWEELSPLLEDTFLDDLGARHLSEPQ